MGQIRQIPGIRCRKWCTCYLLAFLCLALRTRVPYFLAHLFAMAGCLAYMYLRCPETLTAVGGRGGLVPPSPAPLQEWTLYLPLALAVLVATALGAPIFIGR